MLEKFRLPLASRGGGVWYVPHGTAIKIFFGGYLNNNN